MTVNKELVLSPNEAFKSFSPDHDSTLGFMAMIADPGLDPKIYAPDISNLTMIILGDSNEERIKHIENLQNLFDTRKKQVTALVSTIREHWPEQVDEVVDMIMNEELVVADLEHLGEYVQAAYLLGDPSFDPPEDYWDCPLTTIYAADLNMPEGKNDHQITEAIIVGFAPGAIQEGIPDPLMLVTEITHPVCDFNADAE